MSLYSFSLPQVLSLHVSAVTKSLEEIISSQETLGLCCNLQSFEEMCFLYVYVRVFCGNDYQHLKKGQSYIFTNLPMQLSAIIFDFSFINTWKYHIVNYIYY